MNADSLALMIPILGVVIGCPTFLFGLALFFPSTRKALNDRITGRHGGLADSEVEAHLASTNTQLAALRGEVYALRCELAAVAQALPGAQQRQEALKG